MIAAMPELKTSAAVGAGFERHDLVFENFGVGMIEARIDQVGLLAGLGCGAAGHQVEGALGGFGTGEDISRTAKNSGPRGANR